MLTSVKTIKITQASHQPSRVAPPQPTKETINPT
jgi:hypothetical protein